MSILDNLNKSQQDAVLYNDGAHLIIAGAGSGKTRVLTYKIAYLLSNDMLRPWEILALTFTNKAAKEMKERISGIVGDEKSRYINMGTFHSIFSRILHYEAEKLGYQSNFTIYDQNDSNSLLKSIIKDMQLDEKVYKPSSIANIISMAKNNLVTSAEYAASQQLINRDIEKKTPLVHSIYSRYSQRCKQANVMDFDDLLLNTYLLFKDEETRKKYSNRFQYILVDEYQDTNYAQQAILLQLTKDNQHICVVGDDAQSIYGFRGAKIDNILNFTKIYDNAKLFKLEQNYRSTQLIVKAANSLIKKNQHQIPKEVFSEKDSGEPIILKCAYSDKEEASIVCNEIKRLKHNENCQWNNFAILYRTNSQSRSFEEFLRKENIPYHIYGGLSFFQRKEIKDVIAYLRFINNPNDEEAFKRIIKYPSKGIGDTTVQKITHCAGINNVGVWEVVCNPAYYNLEVNKGTRAKIGQFKTMIESWTCKSASQDIYELSVEMVKKTGIAADIYSGKDIEDITRQQNLEEFLSSIQDFVVTQKEEGNINNVYLTDYLQEVSLLTDRDNDNESALKVTLMTIHSAKGLEFPYVFIVGMEENIFPSPMSTGSLRELEEERRLFYVAITRAEKRCYLTCAQNRFRYGRIETGSPSRFIKDIDPKFISQDSFRIAKAKDPESFTSSRPHIAPIVSPRLVPINSSRTAINATSSEKAPVGSNNIKEGAIIEHQRFGIGKVVSVEGTGENIKATVEFKNVGTKQLLLKFAKFNIIG